MFKKILIPVDLAHEEQLAQLMAAAALIADHGQATFDLLYVDQSLVHQGSYPHLDEQTYGCHRQAARARLEALLVDIAPQSGACACHISQGTAHDQILEKARELGSDAILMMARRPGISSYFLGSNAEKVVRHADCSVFVMRR